MMIIIKRYRPINAVGLFNKHWNTKLHCVSEKNCEADVVLNKGSQHVLGNAYRRRAYLQTFYAHLTGLKKCSFITVLQLRNNPAIYWRNVIVLVRIYNNNNENMIKILALMQKLR